MEPQEFWNTYVQDIQPEDFVWRYGRGKVTAAVDEYLRQRPSLFGIVRRTTWRATFRADHQFTREFVSTGIREYLESTEEDWRPKVEEAREQEARMRAEAKARAEAEALALAVARVEAEARARAEAERLKAMTPDAAETAVTQDETSPAVVEQDETPPAVAAQDATPPAVVEQEQALAAPVPVETDTVAERPVDVTSAADQAFTAIPGSGATPPEGVPGTSPVEASLEGVDTCEKESCVLVDAEMGETLLEDVGAEPSDATGQTTDTDAPATS